MYWPISDDQLFTSLEGFWPGLELPSDDVWPSEWVDQLDHCGLESGDFSALEDDVKKEIGSRDENEDVEDVINVPGVDKRYGDPAVEHSWQEEDAFWQTAKSQPSEQQQKHQTAPESWPSDMDAVEVGEIDWMGFLQRTWTDGTFGPLSLTLSEGLTLEISMPPTPRRDRPPGARDQAFESFGTDHRWSFDNAERPGLSRCDADGCSRTFTHKHKLKYSKLDSCRSTRLIA